MAFLRVTLGVKLALFNPLKNDNLYFFKVRLVTQNTKSLSSCAEEKAHSVPLGDESEKFPYTWDDNPDVKAGVKTKER